jgi:hypothetical protein
VRARGSSASARMRRNSNASLTKVCTLREGYWSTWSSRSGSRMRQNSNASLHVCAVHMHDEVLEGDEVVEYLEEYLERSSSLDPTFANVGVSESSHRTLCRSLVTLG